jgi:hypothetical protein
LVGIRELSRRLDDYIGAVSRALNDRADVNPLTRDRLRVYTRHVWTALLGQGLL